MKKRLVVVSVVTLALTACGGGGGNSYSTPTGTTGTTGTTGSTGTTTPPANTIQATDGLVFSPTTLTVARGTTVTFTFGSVMHNVMFNGAGAPANIADTMNGSATRTFSTAGTFGFNCSIHGSYMTGQVTVQ
jgi:plastocyanin